MLFSTSRLRGELAVGPILRDLDEALAAIGDGSMVVVPTDYAGVAM